MRASVRPFGVIVHPSTYPSACSTASTRSNWRASVSVRIWIRRWTPFICASSASARTAHRSCFARSGHDAQGCSAAQRLQRLRLLFDLRVGGVPRLARTLDVQRHQLRGDVAPVPRAPRAARTRQHDPGQHGRRIVEVLGREPEVRPVLREHGRLAVPGRQDHGQSATSGPSGRGSPRPAAGRPRSSGSPPRAPARALGDPPRGAVWPRSEQPPVLVEVAQIAGEVRRGIRRATPGRARVGAPAERRRGRPGTARTTS